MFRVFFRYPLRCYLVALRNHLLEALGAVGFLSFMVTFDLCIALALIGIAIALVMTPAAFYEAFVLNKYLKRSEITDEEIHETSFWKSIARISKLGDP